MYCIFFRMLGQRKNIKIFCIYFFGNSDYNKVDEQRQYMVRKNLIPLINF